MPACGASDAAILLFGQTAAALLRSIRTEERWRANRTTPFFVGLQPFAWSPLMAPFSRLQSLVPRVAASVMMFGCWSIRMLFRSFVRKFTALILPSNTAWEGTDMVGSPDWAQLQQFHNTQTNPHCLEIFHPLLLNMERQWTLGVRLPPAPLSDQPQYVRLSHTSSAEV